MKRITFLCVAILFACIVKAQSQIDNTNIAFLSIGGGFSGASLEQGFSTAPIGAFTLDAGYTRFFKYGLGLGVGIRVANMGTKVTFTKLLAEQTGLTDPEGERYNLQTFHSDICEKHTIWFFEIPVSMQYRYMFTDKWGIGASLGLSAMIPVSARYNTISGKVSKAGYYPEWNVTLHDIDGLFESTDIEQKSGKETATAKFGLAMDLSVKAIYAIHPRIQLTGGILYSQNLVNLWTDKPANSLVVQSLEKRSILPYNISILIGAEYKF